MKTLHINVSVADIDHSVQFYSALFGARPSLLKDDYARWALDDPSLNFAIRKTATDHGVDHLGMQASNDEELAEIYARLESTRGSVQDEGNTTCCYANSTKRWVQDPQAVNWEAFITRGESSTFGSVPSECP